MSWLRKVRWCHVGGLCATVLLVLTTACQPGTSAAGSAAGAPLSTVRARTAPSRNAAKRPPVRHRHAHRHPRTAHHVGHRARDRRNSRERQVAVRLVLPNRRATPGAINPAISQADLARTICRAGYTATVRPSSSYTDAIKASQLAAGYALHGDRRLSDYEEDHLIPLELGGSPTSRRNLWPEPYAGRKDATAKDALENRLHALVCDGSMRLRAAQTVIAKNWWHAYRVYVVSGYVPHRAVPVHPTPARTPRHTRHRTRRSASGSPATRSCTTTSSGSCIEGGEFCPQASYGQTGYDAEGRAYTCTGDADHPHWET